MRRQLPGRDDRVHTVGLRGAVEPGCAPGTFFTSTLAHRAHPAREGGKGTPTHTHTAYLCYLLSWASHPLPLLVPCLVYLP